MPEAYVYVGNRALRPDLYNKRCALVNTWRGKGPHNVQVEFVETAERVICPMRCLRKERRDD